MVPIDGVAASKKWIYYIHIRKQQKSQEQEQDVFFGCSKYLIKKKKTFWDQKKKCVFEA